MIPVVIKTSCLGVYRVRAQDHARGVVTGELLWGGSRHKSQIRLVTCDNTCDGGIPHVESGAFDAVAIGHKYASYL